MIVFQGKNLEKTQLNKLASLKSFKWRKIRIKRVKFSNYSHSEYITDDDDVSISVAEIKWFAK